MKRAILKVGVVLVALLALGTFQGCFKLQRAVGCNNTGIFGCKDEPSEIQSPPFELKPAQGRYLEGHEFPWSRPLDDCMAAGGTRTECFESLPPEILAQFEAWEAERARMRRQQTTRERQSPDPALGVDSNNL